MGPAACPPPPPPHLVHPGARHRASACVTTARCAARAVHAPRAQGSPVHEAARKLKVLAEKKFSELLRESGDLGMLDGAKPKEVSFEMKQELVSNANELSSKELYGMVYIVTQNCPAAMDSSQEEEVEMDVDNLDPDTFMLVDRYVKDCLAKRKVKGKQK